ncbi:MAG TPA: sulfite exporter TauE/SafE family protein [Candidatus Acidoferrum sp.]|nr:sulfite exporter TauE/SafE family protein [Candidatus Acidoferrum sp.]
MMHVIIGFVIALAVGLTGIGGGSFTVPALLLIAGLPAAEAVGTTFVFAGVLRLVAAPFYLAARQVHPRYVRLLLQGAVPGLVLGMIALRIIAKQESSPLLIIVIGLLLTLSSSVTFVPRAQVPEFARKNARWLPWLAFPIGVESGFSSAGAGALGTMLLLNYSEMPPAQVVGTDLLFGLVLAIVGGLVHWTIGTISMPVLTLLLAGGIPGVIVGCIVARKVPAQKLKAVVALIAIFAGLQLVWSGAHTLAMQNGQNVSKLLPEFAKKAQP